ncbi:MAG: hypothetical protein IJR88_01920 [Clostridia bacterium]|nr:hypothetical protein [Clostridia bacterium]
MIRYNKERKERDEMKAGQFFKEHSYDMVKMFLNQFATGLFGFVLTLTFTKIGNSLLRTLCSVFAVLFYLFLLYYMTWEIGYRDRGRVHSGEKPENLFRGTLISLCANLINFVIAIIICIGNFATIPTLASIAVQGSFWLEGMFSGILTNQIFGSPMNSYWLTYFILPLPAIATCTVAYILGYKDKKFTPLFNPMIPKSDRDEKKKYWKK